MRLKASRIVAVTLAGFMLSACNGVLDSSVPKHERPVPEHLVKKMNTRGMQLGAPILLRIFKEENVLEVWKEDRNKRYALLNSYEICKWSGKLGPKHQEGDRQAPEGFYHVSKGLMNPNSSYHLSFNMGFPNAFDRANDRTGSYLMIHGACSSAGCYSMTDEYVEEIYALAREAFRGGQKAFQIQAYPFRMTAENMAKKVNHPDFEFWKMLKEGSDHFEVTKRAPKVDVCEKRYVFNRQAEEGTRFQARNQCPPSKMPRSLALAFNQKQDKDESVFDRLLKHNHASPFVSAALKPASLDMSIKANATIGELTVLDPKSKPVAVAAPAEPKAAAKDDVTAQPVDTAGAIPAPAEGTQSPAVSAAEPSSTQSEAGQNPISAEVLSDNPQQGEIIRYTPPSVVPVPQRPERVSSLSE